MKPMNKQDTDVVQNKTDDYNSDQLQGSPAYLQSFSPDYSEETISSFLDLLKTVEQQNGLRIRKVNKFSRLIDNGTYETEERIDELADRLLDELL